MVGSKDLEPSTIPFFPNVFYLNQFKAKTQWPSPNVNLSGQTAIVTGCNVGLGYEAVLQLLGCKLSHLIVAVRSLERGRSAAAKFKKSFPRAKIDVWELDLSSYKSIQAFCQRADTELPRLDIALLNAGLVRLDYNKVNSTGHEEIFQVDYLSTVFMAMLIAPILKAKKTPGQPGRLTIVSAALTLHASFPNRNATPLFPSCDDPKTFNGSEAYNTAKLLAHFWLWNYVDYVSADDVIVNLADPAWCKGTAFSSKLFLESYLQDWP